jgi:hypothetical protein
MVSEWISKYHKGAKFFVPCRIGPTREIAEEEEITEEELGLLSRWQSWVDAVIIYPFKLMIVEAQMYIKLTDIERLELARRIFMQTKSLEKYFHLPREFWLVAAIEDSYIKRRCLEEGFFYTVYKPSFYDEYTEVYPGRKYRPPLARRF